MAEEDIKALLETMHSENTAAHAETRRQIEETNRHFDVVGKGLRSEIRTIAEGLVATDEKFERRFDTLEEKLERSAAENASDDQVLACRPRHAPPDVRAQPQIARANRRRSAEPR